jgi:hypothetical protein
MPPSSSHARRNVGSIPRPAARRGFAAFGRVYLHARDSALTPICLVSPSRSAARVTSLPTTLRDRLLRQ